MGAKNYLSIRQNFMEDFNNDSVISKTIPEIAARLMKNEFGINLYDYSTIPIVFTVGWTEILKYVGSQPSDEFAIDICGISVEYTTEFSESDKSTNIVPQFIHKHLPIFTINDQQAVPGSRFNEDLLVKYNSWRSVNLMETIDKIERDIYSIVLNEYGLDLMVSATVFPLISAIYAAGIQIARERRTTINMYNIFEIDIADGDKVILTPLATVKQYFKDDSKK